jgi:hypothetical protein
MLRGFLNAMDADDEDCAGKFLCEGAIEAAGRGELGMIIAEVAR